MGKTSNAGRRHINRRVDGLEPSPFIYCHECKSMTEATAVERRWLGMHPELSLGRQFGYKPGTVGSEVFAIDVALIPEYIAEADKITLCDAAESSTRRALPDVTIIGHSDGGRSRERTAPVVDRRGRTAAPAPKRMRISSVSTVTQRRAGLTRESAVGKIDQIGRSRVSILKHMGIIERAQVVFALSSVRFVPELLVR